MYSPFIHKIILVEKKGCFNIERKKKWGWGGRWVELYDIFSY